jgi:Virulence factor BrkB
MAASSSVKPRGSSSSTPARPGRYQDIHQRCGDPTSPEAQQCGDRHICLRSGTNSPQLLVFAEHIVFHQVSNPVSLLSQSWSLLKGAVHGFLEDEALTRGAAIAFYTATSFAPVLLIVIAIAGLVYGQEAAQGAITTQLGDLMGRQTAELLQTAVASSKSKSSGFLAARHNADRYRVWRIWRNTSRVEQDLECGIERNDRRTLGPGEG